jgi:hypothetical protein
MNQQVTVSAEANSVLQSPGLASSVLIVFRVSLNSEWVLPGSDYIPARHLSGADLAFMERLAGAAAEPPSAPFDQKQQALLDDLQYRCLLQDHFAPIPSMPGDMAPSARALPATTEKLALVRPFVLRLDSSGYCYLNHNGQALIRLTAEDLTIVIQFGEARTVGEVLERLTAAFATHTKYSSKPYVMDIINRLRYAGLLQPAANATVIENRQKFEYLEVLRVAGERQAVVRSALQKAAAKELQRREKTGCVRTKIVPVQTEQQPLLSLGLIMSYAIAHEDGRLEKQYEFVRDWCNLTIAGLKGDEAPAIFLFSNYIWSHTANMALSQRAKELNPLGLCIHGGPDTPKYEGDVQRYLELNKHIDILVHGEGELTFSEILSTLERQFADGTRDLTVLKDVPGITYRIGDQSVTTVARERLADLNTIPSPYSNGLFDDIGNLPIILQTIETNRGCPFGCTFCDWGSATLSKIRKFDLERVFSDLEWCAKNKVKVVFNTDANFGVFERDVEIARKVVELKEKYGYPKVFESSYAKNQVKHLKTIIGILASGGVVSTGTLSLQSVSPATLDAIKRSNIKVSKYDELAIEFEKARLPLIVEMMMGLPGSTPVSFLGDIQQAIDREVHARVNPTEVLVNSPMNEPEYRDQFKISLQRPIEDDWKSRDGNAAPNKALIVSTSSFDADDYKHMERWRQLFILMENYGCLRQVARFIRYERGLQEMEFYCQLDEAVSAEPHRWPTIAFTFNSMKDLMVPPGSWQIFIDEVHDYLVNVLDIPDDSALATVLTVQHALLPARDRSFPQHLELAHDYASWHKSMVQSKQCGWEQDWTPTVSPLRDLGPARFSVDDSQQLSTMGMGVPMVADADLDWEFESPIGRVLRFRRTAEFS